MNKGKVFVKKIWIGISTFDGMTIQEVKEYLDRISNDYIDMLYQGCVAKFDVQHNTFDDDLDLYLVFERMETDKEYEMRMQLHNEELQKDAEKKYKEYLKLKEEFEGKPE